MTTLRAILATTALIAAPAAAQDFGQYGYQTMRDLALSYPGRFTGAPETGTTFFAASDYMADRLSRAGAVRVQDFNAGVGPSQNLVVSLPGVDGRTLVVGAHFDTAGTSPDLQGVDDNASGAGVLTELAAHMSGLQTQTGLEFVAFGAEEFVSTPGDGGRRSLQGAKHYVDNLTDAQRANLAGMINIDSLITGDFMYGHAGVNYLDNSDLLSLRNRAHEIARELGIDLRSNPGLNPAYPILTGCCSDAAVFEQFDIPILWLEATNWEIGDLDGYDQTTNPAIPGGRTWHDAELDSWDFLREALGEERFEQRTRDYARILTRLLAEETGADLIASARDAGLTAAQIADLALRQDADLSALSMRAARDRLDADLPMGRIVSDVAVQGLLTPDSSGTFDRNGGAALMARVGGAYGLMDGLSVGTSLAYARSGDRLRDGDIEATGYQLSADAAWRMGQDWVTGAVSWGKSDLSGTRDFALVSGLGAVIAQSDLDWSTNAYTLGARVQAGRDMDLAPGVTWGPVAGLDYSRTRISGFGETGDARTAIGYAGQAIESFEVQLGARIGTTLAAAGRDLALSAQGSLVHDLAEGAPSRIDVTDSGGTARRVSLAGQDRSFARIGLAVSTALSDQAQAWVTLDSRVGHDAGSQATLGAGLGLRF
ncbi:M28 family peptidase [Paracoccus aestuarii]|uniref:M28 family peptidase n=1 Tax=Paracoccus aestuarii TaxID=453842 RepID=A0A418ZW02_9RHOB|nr:autotransporter domain-containing protein [Paracoccus aestuarii]RJL03984.1 M28 family peptidase [Paracoccus aestuarii]WCQ99317.1 autotransporter domain-containing protein [Paracoccus aestuarii]